MIKNLTLKRNAISAVVLSTALQPVIAFGVLTAISPAAAQTSTQNQQEFDLNIPAGSLKKALDQLTADTGIFYSAAAGLVDGKTTLGVKGKMPSTEALQHLLKDSGISYHFVSADSINLVMAKVVEEKKLVEEKLVQQKVELKSITVVGEKVSRDLQETTTSVQLFDNEQLEDSSGVKTYTILLNRLPTSLAFRALNSIFAALVFMVMAEMV